MMVLDPQLIQPRHSRARVTEALIDTILALWGIRGTPLAMADLGGSFNANVRVITEHADVVIRVRPTWVLVERIIDVHELIKALYQRGLATAVPRLSKAGRTYEMIEDRLVELYNYLPEEGNRRWSTGRWQHSFEHMGTLHKALAEVALHVTPPLISNYATPQLARLLIEETTAKITGLSESRNKKEALAICREARRVMERILDYWKGVQAKLPFQLVHGDFHLDNLLFDEQDQVKYTLDFDFVAWRERVYEIAYALRLAMPQIMDNQDGILNMALIRQWLEAYNANAPSPLSDLECEALPYQLAQVELFFIGHASRSGNPLWVVLREASHVELACFLVDAPQCFMK